MPSAGKYETGTKRRKICNQCQAREDMKLVPSLCIRRLVRKKLQPVPPRGKKWTGAKRGKTCIQCLVRKKMQLVPPRGKKFSLCQVRENMQPVPAAEIYAIGALRRGKICSRCQAQEIACKPRQNGFGLSLDWLKENLVCFTLAL